jgi:hypothetical protein
MSWLVLLLLVVGALIVVWALIVLGAHGHGTAYRCACAGGLHP